jgi:hypothetical protein
VETRVVTKLKLGIVFVSETVYTFITRKSRRERSLCGGCVMKQTIVYCTIREYGVTNPKGGSKKYI